MIRSSVINAFNLAHEVDRTVELAIRLDAGKWKFTVTTNSVRKRCVDANAQVASEVLCAIARVQKGDPKVRTTTVPHVPALVALHRVRLEQSGFTVVNETNIPAWNMA